MPKWIKQIQADWSVSAVVAGFLAVLISYSGPLIIVFQAAQQAGVPNEMVVSWIWGISIGAAVVGVFLSIRYKIPIITAWSAPGTALLVALFPHLTLGEMVAAYITAAVIIFVIGISGWFDKILQWIPQGLAAAMMAGILLQFGFGLFKATETMPLIVFGMMGVYLVTKRFSPRYAMVWVLAAGVVLGLALGKMNPVSMDFTVAQPQWISPIWTWSAMVNLALPLVLVSLSGQFLPGMAIIKTSGYDMPAKPIMTATSLASLAVACVGGITIVLASITAALCMGKEAHEAPNKRYIAGIANGFFYVLGGMFAGSIVLLFGLLPKELVATLAGLALLGAIANNLTMAMSNDAQREAALMTLLVTASDMGFLGLSSVFWGIVIGLLSHWILKPWQMTKQIATSNPSSADSITDRK